MKPILFNTEMVQAILAGTKTETRRLIKPQFPTYQDREHGRFSKIEPHGRASFLATHEEKPTMKTILHSPVLPGDILYVRETWAEWSGGYVYKADGTSSPYPLSFVDRWRPSIHMPKEAARIFLLVADVRAEQLQEITLAGVHAEGVDASYSRVCGCGEALNVCDFSIERFESIWDGTIKPSRRAHFGWAANPWVWVIEFERCEKPEEEE